MGTKRLCFSIPMEMKRALQGIARHDMRSSSSLMVKVITKHVKKKTEKKTKK